MVRPVDINLNIQHAPEMSRMATTDNHARPELAAQHYAERLEKQARQQQEQVQRNEASDKNNINPDRKGHGGGYNPKKKTVQKKEEEKKKPPQRRPGDSLVDIRI